MTYPAFALPFFDYPAGTATTRYAEPASYVLDRRTIKTSALLPPPIPSGVPVLVDTALDYIAAVAAVLPLNEDADRRIDALFARQPTRRASRPISRR